MTSYVYRDVGSGLWAVGYYMPTGHWVPESSHEFKGDAANRVHWLNGGCCSECCDPSHEPNDDEFSEDTPTDDELYREAEK
jgi:hypothetical protein